MKVDNLEQLVIKTIEDLRTENDIVAFLTFAGHGNLHNLSIENLLAIYGQNPEAVLVGSFNQWKKRGRYPVQGSGIAVYPGNTAGTFGKYCEYLFDYKDTNGKEKVLTWEAAEEEKYGFLEMYQAHMDYAAFAKSTLYSFIQSEFYEKESDLYFEEENKTESILEFISECATKIFMERSGEPYELSEYAVNAFKEYILNNNDVVNTALFLKTLGVAIKAAHNSISKLNMYIVEEKERKNGQTNDLRGNEADGRGKHEDTQFRATDQSISRLGGGGRRASNISKESDELPAGEISGANHSYADQGNLARVSASEIRGSGENVRAGASQNAGSGESMGNGYDAEDSDRRTDQNNLERNDRQRDIVSSNDVLGTESYTQLNIFAYMNAVVENNINSNSIDVTDMMMPEKISRVPFSGEIIDYILSAGGAGYRLESRNAIYNYFVTRWDGLDHDKATDYIRRELRGASLGFRVEGRDISVYESSDTYTDEAEDNSPFEMKIHDVVFTERKKAGLLLHDLIKKVPDNGSVVQFGEFYGFKLGITKSHNFMTNEVEAHFIVAGAYEYKVSANMISDVGNVIRLQNVLRGLEKVVVDYENRLEETLAALNSAQEEFQKKFPQENMLQKLLKRQAELETILSDDKEEEKAVQKQEQRHIS